MPERTRCGSKGIDRAREAGVVVPSWGEVITDQLACGEVLVFPAHGSRGHGPEEVRSNWVDRAAGRQLWKMGNGTGPCLAVARITPDGGDPDPQAVQRALAHLIDLPGIAGMRLMGVDRAATDIATEEKTMRPGGEGAFRHLLVVEAVSDTAIRGAVPAIEDAAVAAFGPRAAVDLSTRRLVYAEAPHEGPAAR